MRHPDTHQCAANGCARQIPRKFLMCRPHWDLVPRPIQSAVYATYTDGNPTREYVSAVTAAISAVAKSTPTPILPPPPTLFDDGGEDGLVYPDDPTPPAPTPPTPAPKQTLSPFLADLCTAAAARLTTTGLTTAEAKRRLWDTIKDAVPGEPLGEADLARITPEVIAAAEIDVRRHRESNTRASQALTQAEERFTKGQLLKSNGNCRSCGQAVRFIHNAETGKSPPSNLNGTSHFATCPQAGQWRRTK